MRQAGSQKYLWSTCFATFDGIVLKRKFVSVLVHAPRGGGKGQGKFIYMKLRVLRQGLPPVEEKACLAIKNFPFTAGL